MLIKHYRIALPADYDMGKIRERVAQRGASFDHVDGLGIKVFMIRERGIAGSPVSEYSPVYLWQRTEAMWDFLTGPQFEGVKTSFGIPPVEIWPLLALAQSPAWHDPAAILSVTRDDCTLDPGTDLRDLQKREADAAMQMIDTQSGLLARSVGLDPRSWTRVRFDFWALPVTALEHGRARFEALHVSAPGFSDLRATASAE